MTFANKLSTYIYLTLSLSFFAIANSQAQQQTKENERSIVLKSDRSKMDGKTDILEHCGNAILTQLNIILIADCIVGKKKPNGGYAYITATGNPARLTQIDPIKQETLIVSAKIIEYKVSQQQFLITGNALFKLSGKNNDSLIIKAQEIELDNKQVLNRDIIAAGSPIELELVRAGITDLKAKSKKLHFNTGTSNLTLSREVIANLKLGQISAGIFNYNSKTQVSSFEKSDDQQVEIIQTKNQP